MHVLDFNAVLLHAKLQEQVLRENTVPDEQSMSLDVPCASVGPEAQRLGG